MPRKQQNRQSGNPSLIRCSGRESSGSSAAEPRRAELEGSSFRLAARMRRQSRFSLSSKLGNSSHITHTTHEKETPRQSRNYSSRAGFLEGLWRRREGKLG